MSFPTARARSLRIFLTLGSFIAANAATSTEAAQSLSPEREAYAPDTRHDKINAVLRLRQSALVTLSIDAGRDGTIVVTVPIGDVTFSLDLWPHSIRAANYQVLAQIEDGSLVNVEPGPVRTLRGSVKEDPGSIVVGALLEDGLYARIIFADGQDAWLEPIGARIAEAAPDQYVVYQGGDVVGGTGTCGVDAAMFRQPVYDDAVGASPARGDRADGLCVAEFAADADYEYFQAYGSIGAVEDRINAIMNAVNIEYERDAGITHVITAIVVRTAEPDPYDDPDFLGQLLTQFQEHWLAYHTDIPRDVAQLFTGRDLTCPGVGIARLSSICTDEAFSLVLSDADPSFACVTQLTAHELGHNWGADHCVWAYTMNPTIWGWNEFHPVDTIPEIIAFRDTRTCLDSGSGESAPLAPSNLDATPTSSSQIDLAWTDNADNELGFEIERSEDDGTTWASIDAVDTDVTSYSDTGLAAGTTYIYRVFAFNDDGDSPYSNTATATTHCGSVGVHEGAGHRTQHPTGRLARWSGP